MLLVVLDEGNAGQVAYGVGRTVRQDFPIEEREWDLSCKTVYSAKGEK